MISLLFAMDKNHVIGLNGQMPWHLPNDLQFFKKKTMGHTIIMGRKTFESIGRVLPQRKHVVITKNEGSDLPKEVDVFHTIDDLLKANQQNPNDELFVIGGGTVFKQILPFASRMYITFIDHTFEGDVYFPMFKQDEWSLTSKVKGDKNDKNPYDYYFLQCDRRK